VKRRACLITLTGAWWAAAHASDEVPPPAQKAPLVISGATIHTVGGPVVANGRMLVERGRITAIAGPGEALNVPAGAQTVDLAGRHVYPGFVAANTALGLVEIVSVRATVDTTETGPLNPNARALVAINPDSELLPVTRANGVLAALSVPGAAPGGGIAGTSALVQMDGWTWEEMALAPALGLHVMLPTLRHNPALFRGPTEPLRDELRRFTEQRLRQIDDAFAAAAAYVKARAADPATPVDARLEGLAAAVQGRQPVFVHADELAQIRHALALAERHALKLVIVGGLDAWRMADVLRERQVPVVIAGVHRLPLRREDDVDGPFRLAARLAEAGVRFCIARPGGVGNAANERNLAYEAATAAAHGLPRDEALKAITLYAAQILGVEDRLGSLQPGRLASFIVTDGDPLETPTKIERVFVQGREVDAGNRQLRLAEKYRQRYRQLAR
jgi:imidazolonepropionase-like amidohydrolase